MGRVETRRGIAGMTNTEARPILVVETQLSRNHMHALASVESIACCITWACIDPAALGIYNPTRKKLFWKQALHLNRWTSYCSADLVCKGDQGSHQELSAGRDVGLQGSQAGAGNDAQDFTPLCRPIIGRPQLHVDLLTRGGDDRAEAFNRRQIGLRNLPGIPRRDGRRNRTI